MPKENDGGGRPFFGKSGVFAIKIAVLERQDSNLGFDSRPFKGIDKR
jgi:hypothetical protein